MVGATYADGQYWDDTYFWIPEEAARIEVTVNYQTVTRHYIEALRDGNVTDDWGDVLYQLRLDTNKGAPIPMVSEQLTLFSFVRGDADGSGSVGLADFGAYVFCMSDPASDAADGCDGMDFDGDDDVDMVDFLRFQRRFAGE